MIMQKCKSGIQIYCGDNVHRIMDDGIIMAPPYEFELSLHSYYWLYKIRNYGFGVVSNA
jgi:hypothetical protein